MSGKLRPEEAVRATLTSMPDEVVDTINVTSLPSEDSVSERRRKLEFLEMQEEMIKVNIFCVLSFYKQLFVCLRNRTDLARLCSVWRVICAHTLFLHLLWILPSEL